MKKKIVTFILCGGLLYAGWYDDIKETTTKAYEQTVIYADDMKGTTTKAYEQTVIYANESYNKTKDDIDTYQKAKVLNEQAELNNCIIKLEETLPKYGLFLEKNYMNVNKRNEAKILQSYQRLNSKGIDSNLKNKIDPKILEKFSSATSNLEYTSIVLSELKRIKKTLKDNNQDMLNDYVQQIELLMYAWTTPMEILSTRNIYNQSLLDLSSNLYGNLNKENYENYTKFIYSMLFVNLINETIEIEKDTKVDINVNTFLIGSSALEQNSDYKNDLENICKEESNIIADNYLTGNMAITLGIDEEKIDKEIHKIAKNNNLFEGAILFNKNMESLKKVSIIDNPLNDYWYLMIREYMALQDDFYKMKKEIDQIIKVLSILPNTDKQVALLKQNMFDVDALYRKFDETVRYNIVDLPISIYADLYHIEFRKGKKWYNDDEKVMSDISIAYNKACANMQKYMISEFSIGKVMRITRALKKEFNEKEWSEVKTRAKLTQDWFNMLNKIQIKNK